MDTSDQISKDIDNNDSASTNLAPQTKKIKLECPEESSADIMVQQDNTDLKSTVDVCATASKKKLKKKIVSILKSAEEKDEDELTDDESINIFHDLPDYSLKFGIEEEEKDVAYLNAPHTNLLHIIIDEVCLEGLDGITLEALWTRISVTIKQSLPFPLHICRYIWNLIKLQKDIEFYELQEPRPKLVIYDRYKDSEPDLGVILDSAEPFEDIYLYQPVKDDKVLGSASSYTGRKNITTEVRTLTLEEAELKYASCLIMVASQKLRMHALINPLSDPTLELTSHHYCLLERIGRSRNLGEVTFGKVSLQTICRDPKMIFYYKKILFHHKLIYKQLILTKSSNSAKYSLGSLFHLLRFYNQKKTKSQVMTEQVVEVLRKQPMYRMEYGEAKKVFGNDRALKKLCKLPEFQKFVKTDVCYNYRELHPHATVAEWKIKNSDRERKVRTMELVDPCVNVAGSWNEEESKDDSSDEEQVNQIAYNMPLLNQIYEYIKLGGPEGKTLKDIQREMGLEFYTVRASINNLVAYKLIVGVKIDVGRQRTVRYHTASSTKIKGEYVNSDHDKFQSEAISFLSDVLEIEPEYLNTTVNTVCEEDVVGSENHKLIKKLKSERKLKKTENKTKYLGCQSKSGESLLDQLMMEKEKLKLNNQNTVTIADNEVVEMTSNLPDSNGQDEVDSPLKEFFLNRHPYEIAKNNYIFNAKPELPDKDLQQVCMEICQNKNQPPCYLKDKHKRIKHILLKITETNKKSTEISIDELTDINCPIKFCLNNSTYCKLCRKVIGLSKPILSCTKYKIKLLLPKPTYMCKSTVSDKLLEKYSFNHPLLETDLSLLDVSLLDKSDNLKKRKREVNDDNNPKRLKLDDRKSGCEKEVLFSFMGPKPTILFQSKDEDNIEVTAYISTKPEDFDDVKDKYIKDNNATLRILKRASLIVDAIRQEKIISDTQRLHKLIEDHDKQEGYFVKVDRKSIKRIYTRLIKSGLIKIVQIVLKFEQVRRSVFVICDPTLNVQHSMLDSTIEQIKMKFFVNSQKKNQEEQEKTKTQVELNPELSNINKSVGELKQLCVNDSPYVYNRTIGWEYGYTPKFKRLHILHKFLFYLIYCNDEIKAIDPSEVLQDLNSIMTEEIVNEMPTIYSKEVDWKMFVPPLPKHSGWSDGWALVCDMILRLPLSIFVKICRVSFVIPELFTLLNHPVKQHYLVKNLPADIRNGLLHRRKYIFTLHESLCRLCYIGVLQFGPQKLREKDQLFIYLNRNATLLNTTSSAPGYHYIEDKEYEEFKYHFTTTKDIDYYWEQMWNICTNTKLGHRNTVVGTYIAIEQLDSKPAMLKAVKPQTPTSAVLKDDGTIPGDKRGAAGLDSALWPHIKRNWVSTEKILRSTVSTGTAKAVQEGSSEEIKKKTLKNKSPKLNKIKPVVGHSKGFRRKLKVESNLKKNVKKDKTFLRKVTPRQDFKVSKRESYDIIDRRLMESLKQSRSEWKEHEDKILIICKIVSVFLCPSYRKQFISYTVIRDVLHKLSTGSVNKTSGACQRRLSLLFGTYDQQSFLAQLVGTLHGILYIKKYFCKFFNTDNNCIPLLEKQLHSIFVFLVVYFHEHQNELYHIFDAITFRYKVQTNFKSKNICSKENLTSTNGETKDSDVWFSQPNEMISYEFIKTKMNENKLYPYTEDFVLSETDIMLDTIISIIHSTVGNRQDDIRWTLQLFKIYENYADEHLRTALKIIRNSQMIVSTKALTRRLSSSQGVPISSKLFQFSHYYCLKQITKYPPNLFIEAHEVFLGIMNNIYTLRDLDGKGLSMDCFDQGHSVGVAELAVYIKPSFYVEIPKEVLILNPNTTDHTELIKELAIRYKKMLTMVKQGIYFNEEDNENQEGCDETDLSKLEKPKYNCRVPMIQRFLKSWFLTDEADDDDDENDSALYLNTLVVEKEKKIDITEKKTDKKVDKKKKNFNQITSEQSRKILESLNPQHHTPDDAFSSEQERQTIKHKTDNLSSCIESNLSFEDYEKKLEGLLHGTDIENDVLDDNEEILNEEDTKEECSGMAVSDETNVLEKYINSKKQAAVTAVADEVDASRLDKIAGGEFTKLMIVPDNSESDILSNARMQFLMNDELTTEQIMEQMLLDCPDEERKVPKPINLARLLVTGLFPDLDEDEEKLERLHQHFVIMCPDTYVFIDDFQEDLENNFLKCQYPQICKNLLRKVQMDIIINDTCPEANEVINKLRSADASDQDVKVALQLIDFVFEKGVIGASVKQIKERFTSNFENVTLSEILNYLMALNVLLRVGINCLVYIHHKYRAEWLVESCTLDDADKIKLQESQNENKSDAIDIPSLAESLRNYGSYKALKLRITPWARIDGTLNTKIFEKWMVTTLGHCLANEMMPLMSIVHLCYYLKPTEVYYVLECLQELGCLKMTLISAQKTTLFSTPGYVNPIPADMTSDFEDIYIETNSHALIRLGAFLNKKLKDFDFPSDEAKRNETL